MRASRIIIPVLLFIVSACEAVELDNEYQQTLAEGEKTVGSEYTLTLQATKGGVTKALELDGNTLNGYWVDGEKVGVYVNGTYCGFLTADATREKSATATLSGTLSPSSVLAVGKTITLLYPDRTDIDIEESTRWDYTGQNGAVPTPAGDLSTKYDYMTATLTINSIENGVINITAPASFQSEQSIYRFDFKVNEALTAVKWFSVSSNRNKLVTSRSYSGGWGSNHGDLSVSLTGNGSVSPYVSLRNENTMQTDTYSFVAMDGNEALLLGSKEIPSEKLGNGKFIAPSVPLTQPVFCSGSGSIHNAEDVL